MQSEIRQLLAVLDQAYDRKSWHGTNLRGSLRGLSPSDAVWRPAPHRHNIQELAVHAAYWKYAVMRRVTGGTRGTFPLKGSNWFARDTADASAWRDDLALLARMHVLLREAVERFPAARLERPLAPSALTAFHLISGAAAHDLYHAGQIQLIKVMRKESGT